MISEFVEYVKQVWKNKPNVSSPLNADRLNHMEAGIENNSKKIKETVLEVNELTEKILTAKYFEISVTTSSNKDIPTGMYRANAYIANADAYPSDKKVIAKFPIAVRTKNDAGRSGTISYRDSDGFIGVAYIQPDTDMIISCVAFFI